MQDIKVNFNGDKATMIDLTSRVEGKDLYRQKCLINLATQSGTDPIYRERGTGLLAGAIGGLAVGVNEAAHLGNFAALDTQFFVRTQEYKVNEQSPDLVLYVHLAVNSYNGADGVLSYDVRFDFADGSSSGTVVAIPTQTI